MAQLPGQGSEPKADSQQPPLLLGGFPFHLLHGENEKGRGSFEKGILTTT